MKPKKLTWIKNDSGTFYKAESPIAEYHINKQGNTFWLDKLMHGDIFFMKKEETLEQCKNIAQNHFNDIVFRCLE